MGVIFMVGEGGSWRWVSGWVIEGCKKGQALTFTIFWDMEQYPFSVLIGWLGDRSFRRPLLLTGDGYIYVCVRFWDSVPFDSILLRGELLTWASYPYYCCLSV